MNGRITLLVALALSLCAACAESPASAEAASAAPNTATAPAPAQTPVQASARPPGIAVASAHPLATDAGIEVMQAGGNAFDAAVAVSAALSVVEPTGSGIGGGGFWLLHVAGKSSTAHDEGRDVFVDGREVAPMAATENMYLDANGKAVDIASRDGALAAGIPGEPAALVALAAKYGKLGLARDLAPAIRYAHDGFAVDPKLAHAIAENATRLSPAAAAIFVPAGKPLAAGDQLVQADLAKTLQQLAAKGAAGFYRGAVAQTLVAGVRSAHGIWSEDDLARYSVVEREPLVTYFRDYKLVTSPPPSAGGIALAETLQQLEVLGWTDTHDAAAKHLVIESLRRAYHDRAQYLGDPDFVSIPLTRLASRDYAISLARTIDRKHATPSASLDAAAKSAVEGGQTSHFSVIDADGNRVAATMSINLSFGSGFMVPGTGVMLNDEMDDFAASTTASNAYGLIGSKANAVAPRKRPLSTMTPSFVEGPNGTLVIGTPGGSRIATMVLLGILNFVDGADAQSIVSAPRYHHQYLPDVVQFEPGALSDAEQHDLTAMGDTLKPLSSTYGNLQVVLWKPQNDTLQAAADPRAVGAGRVVLMAAPH